MALSSSSGALARRRDDDDSGGAASAYRMLQEDELAAKYGPCDPPIATASVKAMVVRPGVAGDEIETFIGPGGGKADAFGTRIAIPIDAKAAAAIAEGRLTAITGLANGATYAYSVQSIDGGPALVVEGPAFADFAAPVALALAWKDCDPSQLVVELDEAQRDAAGMEAVAAKQALVRMADDLEKFEAALAEHARRNEASRAGSTALTDLPNEALLRLEAQLLREIALGDETQLEAYERDLQAVHDEMTRRSVDPGGLAYTPEIEALVVNLRELISRNEQIIAEAIAPFGEAWEPETVPTAIDPMPELPPLPLIIDLITEQPVPPPIAVKVSSTPAPRAPSTRKKSAAPKRKHPPLWLLRMRNTMRRRGKMRRSRRGLCPF